MEENIEAERDINLSIVTQAASGRLIRVPGYREMIMRDMAFSCRFESYS